SLNSRTSLAVHCFGGSSLYSEASALYITVFASVFIPAGQIIRSSKNSKAQSKQRRGYAKFVFAHAVNLT
ncbi:MAG: hypothetical protein ACYTDW_19010, partial [Planctomycetota bacterium]